VWWRAILFASAIVDKPREWAENAQQERYLEHGKSPSVPAWPVFCKTAQQALCQDGGAEISYA
jgi:hypothetical protein